MHTVTPLLAAGVRIPRGQRQTLSGELIAMRMTAQFSSAKRDGWKLELRKSGVVQSPPEVCMPLLDPRLLTSAAGGHLVIGHQIQAQDGQAVCVLQEWWIAGQLPDDVMQALR